MASLSPPTLSITANKHNAASKIPSSSSFSPLLIKPKFSNSPKVGKPTQYYASRLSCKATKDNSNSSSNEPADKNKESTTTNLGMFDRRNILLGLGGLYGAATTLANNDSSSLASPILPPDLTQCGPPDLPPGAKPTDCCPPLSSNIIDFTLPVNPRIKVRRAAHLANHKYLEIYKEALNRMKGLDENDPRSFTQQAKIHCAYCDGAYHQVGFPNLDLQVHNSWLFFPFHRWYLYFYERILASLVKDLDPNFAIPFWDWDASYGIPPMYVDPKSPLYDSLRNANHQPPTLVDLNFSGTEEHLTPEQQREANNNTMYLHMVSNSNGSDLFFGSAYRAGDKSDPGGGSIENVPHGTVHLWTGDNTQPNFEDMGTFYSAGRDPIFYSHHSNVDRMWSIWRTLGGRRKEPTDPDWLEAAFLFYDENKNLVRVKVKDSIDTKKLGYVYQEVPIPWLTKPKARQAGKTSRKTVTKQSGGVGAAQAAEIDHHKETNFPLLLDSNVRVVVKRPKKGRSKAEKEEEEEVLVVEGIQFEREIAVKFDVYINDEDDVAGGPTKIEFAGSFVSVPHKHKHHQGKMETSLRLGITELLEDLGAEDDEHVVVTLVPKFGKGHVTIGGIKIVFHK